LIFVLTTTRVGCVDGGTITVTTGGATFMTGAGTVIVVLVCVTPGCVTVAVARGRVVVCPGRRRGDRGGGDDAGDLDAGKCEHE
jgi:hypothetical protein